MMTTAQQIGRRLKALRTYRHVPQTALAAEAGISREYVRKLEGGQSDPTVGLLARLAKVLRVPVAALTHPGKLWLCAACGHALYVTATRTTPPHALGVRFHDQKPFQVACAGCQTLIRVQPDPPGGTNLLPLGGGVVML
jgi:transcriptional regulator with XRE-family HTH domain